MSARHLPGPSGADAALVDDAGQFHSRVRLDPRVVWIGCPQCHGSRDVRRAG